MALARTSPEGALDRTWDGDGVALARARDATVATDVLLDPEGRAVAAGHASAGSAHDFALARFDGAGALDRSFGGGLVLTSFPGVTVARATALARQADGKLVVAGIACASGSGPQCSGGSARLALARYDVAPGAAAPPPGGGTLGGTATPRSAPFVGLPSRLVARRGRVRVRVRCLQAARCRGTLTLRRLRTGKRSLRAGLDARLDPRPADAHGRGAGAPRAPRLAPPRARADGVRRARRGRQAETDRQARSASATLTAPRPSSA